MNGTSTLDMPISVRIAILDAFMIKLGNSGYSTSLQENIFKSGLEGYYKMVTGEVLGGRRVNMCAQDGVKMREARKLSAAKNWYKPKTTDITPGEESNSPPGSSSPAATTQVQSNGPPARILSTGKWSQ